MKKIIFTLTLVLILAFSSVQAFAAEIIVNIDSNQVTFNDQTGKPFIDENSRTQVPFRQTLEQYGAKVEWNNEKRIATATKGDIIVEIPIGANYIIKNGVKITNDTTSRIVGDRTYLPIRKVIEAFESEVQWDASLNTVVITTKPIDVKSILTLANKKSSAWKSYDGKILLDMSMPLPDGNGNTQNMAMKMNMNASIFMDPIKMKITADMEANFMGENVSQHIMDMYLTMNKDAFITYIGADDGTGTLTWQKATTVDASLSELLTYNSQVNQELADKYIKDVKFFGKYKDNNGRTLLKIQYTMSGDMYEDLLGTYMEDLMKSTAQEDIMAAEMLKNMKDITLIAYIDEASGEMVKYEMDLSSLYSSMFGSMTGIEGMTAEDLAMLSNLKAKMVMEISNVNKAEDFTIPKEALNAPEVEKLQDGTVTQ